MSPLMVPRARVAKMRARRALPVPVPAPFADSDPSSLCWYSKQQLCILPLSYAILWHVKIGKLRSPDRENTTGKRAQEEGALEVFGA